MIKCKVCGQKFENMISWTHLKKHDMTVKDYKERYGEVVSENYKNLKRKQSVGSNNPNYNKKQTKESREKISLKNKGKQPHNKNKNMSKEQKEKLSKKAKERNQYWNYHDIHPLKGKKHSNSTKEKIRQQRKFQKITSEQAYKALETKKQKGHDLAFFRGMKHTQEAKEKISQKSKEFNSTKTAQTIKESKERLKDFGYNLISVESNFVRIECQDCKNIFSRTRQYTAPSKINKELCPYCYPPLKGTSYYENEIYDFLKSYTPKVFKNDQRVISPKEIDFYLPDFNLGIEFNGLYWHSEVYKTPKYHLTKKNQASENGVNLIHIFEDEWVNKKEITKSRILFLIGETPSKIQARKCRVLEISSKEASNFLNENHLQGNGRSNVRLGLYYKNSLVSVMTFLKNDVSKKVRGWELNRFCSLKYTHVVGGANKLFKYFVKNYNPEKITTFSDKRWSKNEPVYKNLGFVCQEDTPPNYWYFMPNELLRYHRFALKKPKEVNLTEKELRSSQGYLRIYDCGSSKWIWNNS